MDKSGRPGPRGAALCAALCLAAAPVGAQQPAAGNGTASQGAAAEAAAGERASGLDAVTVKGERIERSLRDTASSVTVVTEDDLREQVNRGSVSGVIAEVPNVLYPDTVSAPIIRGQDTQGPNFGASAFLGGTVPRATINLDGRYLSYNELVFGATSIWDLDGIEIYRGPQTTSQGANSIAGAMIVRTKDPTFHREGAALLEAGRDNFRRGAAMLSGALIDNELAARLSVDYWSRDTFIDYVNPNFSRGRSDQDFESLDSRLKLLWKPSALPGLQAKLTLAHASSNRPTSEAASTPYSQYQSRTASMPSFNQKADSIIADVRYVLSDALTVTDTMQYTKLAVHRVVEPSTNGNADIDQHYFSNDLRLNFGDRGRGWSGVGGLFYGHTKSDEALYIRGVSTFDDTKKNLGVYGEIHRRLAERWLLTAGLRYQRDSIERRGSTVYARQALDYERNFDALLPKVSVAYDASRDVTVGAMVSKGYNPGGTGLSFAQAAYVPFDKETVWNYELFTRASLLGGRLNLSGNLFYSEFKDSQRLLPDYLNGVLYGAIAVNADKARSHGLELSADYQATRDLRLRTGIGLLDTKINRFTAGGAVLQGKEFGRAPRYTLSLAADWTVDPQWRLGAEVRRVDRYYSTDENLPAYLVDAYTVANLRVSYRATRHVELFAYVNNLFDKAAPTWKYDDRTAGGIAASMLAPRFIGAGVKATF